MTPHGLYRSLEHRFDGEIPDHLRRLALAGGSAAIERAAAEANSRCCDRLALLTLNVAAAGRNEPVDLGIWRQQGLAWHDRVRASRSGSP